MFCTVTKANPVLCDLAALSQIDARTKTEDNTICSRTRARIPCTCGFPNFHSDMSPSLFSIYIKIKRATCCYGNQQCTEFACWIGYSLSNITCNPSFKNLGPWLWDQLFCVYLLLFMVIYKVRTVGILMKALMW